MPKIHQLLAMFDDLKGQATKTATELKGTFKNKTHIFEEAVITFNPLAEGAQTETTQEKTLNTTVAKEIQWVNKYFAKAIDNGYAIDIANDSARADVVVNGKTLLKNVPVTALMRLQHSLDQIHELITTIPTLDSAKGFRLDTSKGPGIYRAREIKTVRSKKEDQPVVLYPATDKHPAQVTLKTYDVPVGHLVRQEWSGMITPAKKSELLDNVEDLRRAVKAAISEANDTEVSTADKQIGYDLLNYIYKPLFTPEIEA